MHPSYFKSRWAMSYLCGPLTKNQIKTLMDPVRSKHLSAPAASATAAVTESADAAASSSRPVVPAGIKEKFLAITDRVPDGYRLEYRPGLLAKGKVHFVHKSDGVDVWQDVFVLQPVTPSDDIWQGAMINAHAATTDDRPDGSGQFAELPAELARDKSYTIFARQLKDHLYREASLKLLKCESIDGVSNPDESETDFRSRLIPTLSQLLAAKKAKLEDTYAPKLARADTQVRAAQTRVSTQRWQFFARLGTALGGRR